MDLALEEAKLAYDCCEVPVGSVLVNASGQILGQGHNECIGNCDVSGHAEIVTLRRAGQKIGNYRFNDCILVVTLEPCAMCAAALVLARVAGVVYGCLDALAGAIVSRVEYLDGPCVLGPPIWHMGGVRSVECATMLQNFFQKRR
ncbi:MAG: nucleoside deaminase [Desulfovibrionaceae bacterium]|nr:nucleoside deaminase [Desulfovibrionaceae bacterium]